MELREPDRRLTDAVDPVDAALSEALSRASAAGEWPVVALLAGELQARRLARAATNVVALSDRRRDRG